jgi:SAM-dependent methyltransferase
MTTALHTFPVATFDARVRDAWSVFWADAAQTRCASGAPEVWRVLEDHWRGFASSLPVGARVLDLGCGAGVLARVFAATRGDLRVVGVDAAKVPASTLENVELLSDVPMESLPFGAAAFDAVVSQFGFEYSRIETTVREVVRVLAPGGRVALLVHHAGSAIVADTRARLGAIVRLLEPPMRSAFCAGDAATFHARMTALAAVHPGDELITQLAHALPARITWAQPRRLAVWRALEQALEPERCVSESLMTACVAPDAMARWLDRVRAGFAPRCRERCDADGVPVAWAVDNAQA